MPYEAYIQTTRNYIPTTKKYIPTTRKDIPSTKKYILTTSKLHPNYEQTTSQLRGRRSEKLKKCLISFNWGQIQGKYSHRGQYFGLNFIFTKFGFAPMFPFKQNNDPLLLAYQKKNAYCSAWLRLKLNTKMGLNHTTLHHTTPHPTPLHHQELLEHFQTS